MKKTMILGLTAMLLATGCAEYQGRQTNCWAPAKPAQSDTVARNSFAFADEGCDYVALDALVPLAAFAKGIE